MDLGTDKLTRIIAQTLYRLMAYKDEYEVARLYTNGDFQRRLAQQFDGPVKLKFHLAPPLLSRRNEKGELQKMTFGGWIMPVFKVLARLKFLRGTVFDIFGYTAERKMERQWIKDYLAAIESVLPTVTTENLDDICEFMALPQQIRGYGHVKEAAHHRLYQEWSSRK